jgi:hypothetical protein
MIQLDFCKLIGDTRRGRSLANLVLGKSPLGKPANFRVMYVFEYINDIGIHFGIYLLWLTVF